MIFLAIYTNMKDRKFSFSSSDAKAFNKLAREEMKHKLLADILMDMQICRIE